jgi:Kef-type K+ transport system membrane component KefB
MDRLERLLIPIFLVVLVLALAMESLEPKTIRAAGLVIAPLIGLALLLGFVARYAKHRSATREAKRLEREAFGRGDQT